MNSEQLWCYTDAEYDKAKLYQSQVEAVDPKHEHLPKIIVIDCRQQY